MEVVVVRVVEVEQAHDVVVLLLAVEEAHLDARLQVVVEGLVALFERTALDVLDLEDGLVDRGSREALVDASKGILQDAREEYVAVLIGSALDVGAVQVRVAELVGHVFDDALLVEVLVEAAGDHRVGIGVGAHGCY